MKSRLFAYPITNSIQIALSLCLCLNSGLGCSTHATRISQPRNLFYEGQLEACRNRLEKLHKSHRQDRDVTNLDLAVVDLLEGRCKESEARLKEVRDRFDHLEQESLSEKTLSMSAQPCR